MITNGAFSLLSIFFVLVCRFMHYRRLPVCVCALFTFAGIERVSHMLTLYCMVCVQHYADVSNSWSSTYVLYFDCWWIKRKLCKNRRAQHKTMQKEEKQSACNCDRSESARLFHIASICHLLLCVLRSLPIAIFSDSFRLPSLFDSL